MQFCSRQGLWFTCFKGWRWSRGWNMLFRLSDVHVLLSTIHPYVYSSVQEWHFDTIPLPPWHTAEWQVMCIFKALHDDLDSNHQHQRLTKDEFHRLYEVRDLKWKHVRSTRGIASIHFEVRYVPVTVSVCKACIVNSMTAIFCGTLQCLRIHRTKEPKCRHRLVGVSYFIFINSAMPSWNRNRSTSS